MAAFVLTLTEPSGRENAVIKKPLSSCGRNAVGSLKKIPKAATVMTTRTMIGAAIACPIFCRIAP